MAYNAIVVLDPWLRVASYSRSVKKISERRSMAVTLSRVRYHFTGTRRLLNGSLDQETALGTWSAAQQLNALCRKGSLPHPITAGKSCGVDATQPPPQPFSYRFVASDEITAVSMLYISSKRWARRLRPALKDVRRLLMRSMKVLG